ncbi:membrane hypothetical protein [Weissella viridescens]|uniref:Predicted membrane protein n=1 Tax=Weissella viridescens TaxID=1629 RepID=A0A0R2H4S3_WEIVI|nr:DUF805 domain-containing protein [Weissella viridescens]KRN46630.1 hypothetical protein IV50_GL000913 [Weissella viridescens]MCB6840009.1 DUF805 domain-containing protein [Weissella viridescens]MCB6846757.1 DUF805 domain-containing protein [Weissella viridescens]QOD86414.1 DUF805 domain-containing protein [Weissella viridescens]WJI91546.1 DUF805 domain-containing protein [Weissella viridescens]
MEYLLAYLNESNGFKFGKLFQFKGTLDRKSFFIGGLAWIILMSLILTPLFYLGLFLIAVSGMAMQSVFAIVAVIFLIIFIGLLLQALAAMARRLGSAGVSKYFLFFILIPFIGAIILLWEFIKEDQFKVVTETTED